MWRKKDKDQVAAKRAVATLRLPDVTPETRLAMSWTPPGGHEVISKPKPRAQAKSQPTAKASPGKKKVAHSRSAKTKAKGKRSRTTVAE